MKAVPVRRQQLTLRLPSWVISVPISLHVKVDAVEILEIFHTTALTSVQLMNGALESEHTRTTSLSLPLKLCESFLHVQCMQVLF